LGPIAEYRTTETHDNRFVALYVGKLGHTDIHYLKPEKDVPSAFQQYLIAFLDDRSRYLLYYEILNDKTMVSAACALDAVVQRNGRPYQVTTDNEMAFLGPEFQEILEIYEIKHWRPNPRPPQ
jgi:transposase InsO family protein